MFASFKNEDGIASPIHNSSGKLRFKQTTSPSAKVTGSLSNSMKLAQIYNSSGQKQYSKQLSTIHNGSSFKQNDSIISVNSQKSLQRKKNLSQKTNRANSLNNQSKPVVNNVQIHNLILNQVNIQPEQANQIPLKPITPLQVGENPYVKSNSTQQYVKAFQKVTALLKQKENLETSGVKDNERSASQISLTDINEHDNSSAPYQKVKHKFHQFNKKKSRNSADLYNSQKGGSGGANYFSLKTKGSRNVFNSDFHSWTNNSDKLFQSLRNELTSIEHDPSIMMQGYEPAKYSNKRNGIITAYGANTNQGIIRTYNEDRVAIILNIMKPKNKEIQGDYWPKCSYFGIYDGHGGSQCAEFLRDYLHQFIIKDDNFPSNPIQAIRNGFREAERLFLEFAERQEEEIGDIDRSGSCAIVSIIIDEMCYVANVGDSRAVMSAEGGQKIFLLSTDHKPTEEGETKRIIENGGRIYQNSSVIPGATNMRGQQQVIMGPHRVFPGRLSVSRAFGDIEAKLLKYEGNPKVLIAEPDITAFRIKETYDFMVIACDGIFDKLNNKDVIHLPWQSLTQQPKETSTHQYCGLGVDAILKTSAFRKSCDNLTAVFIAFDNFERIIDNFKSNGALPSFGEDQIEEILLEPIPEVEPQKQMVDQIPQVLFIDNDDLDEDDEFVAPLHQNQKKIPVKPNLLSEISEEDDVSMASERKDNKQPIKSVKSSRPLSNRKTMDQLQVNSLVEKKSLAVNNSMRNHQQNQSLGQLLSKTLKGDKQLTNLLDNSLVKRQKSNSRNGIRQALSLKSQTQQMSSLLEQVNQNLSSIPKLRPTSASKRRMFNSNGAILTKVDNQSLSNITQLASNLYNNRKPSKDSLNSATATIVNNATARNQMKLQKINLSSNLTQTMQIPIKTKVTRNQFISQRWQSLNKVSNTIGQSEQDHS